MVIYADILLAVNWWVDFLLLLGASRLVGLGAKCWRLIAGSLVGALFSVVLFLPALPMGISLLLKLLAACGMVLVAFGLCGRRHLVQLLLLVFGLSAGIAGVSGALYFFVAPPQLYVFNGVVYYAVSPWLLLAVTTGCYGIVSLIEYQSRKRAPHKQQYMLEISHQGRSVRCQCLYDSGNHLVEPFSNRPVLVVERMVIESIISLPTKETELPPNGMWRIIPFNTIGGDGILPAFLSDAVTVIKVHEHQSLPPCYIAVCDRLGKGEYHGLIGTALGNFIT